MVATYRCERCKDTGGVLVDEGQPGDPQPGPCPECLDRYRWPGYDEAYPDEDDPDDGEDDGPDEWDPSADADPGCDLCFGAGGRGSQVEGWKDCPDCFDAWLADQGQK